MMINVFFYVFAFFLILSSLFVVACRNPVHAVIALISCFISASGLFLVIGAEFIAMLLVVVYVGAVAVLFLFTVMMLDLDIEIFKKGIIKNIIPGIVVAFLFLLQLFFAISKSPFTGFKNSETTISNTYLIGTKLYNDYFIHLQMVGIILLVGMIGAIVLALSKRKQAKVQDIRRQLQRTKETAMEIKKVDFGIGIKK